LTPADEFHHASATSYRKILDYFKPKFLLGLTATPHRMDKKDVFEICDFNVPYEVGLFSAINRDWLVPFSYYGIYDGQVNYDKVTYLHGRYVEEELGRALATEDRADLIFKHYSKHRRQYALGFCATIKHAEYMAGYFNSRGIKALTIHSDTSSEYWCERSRALEAFRKGEIDIIFAVDMLNEGVDVPQIDLIMFLRPTESPTVFLQQLGRGLRHSSTTDKSNLKVLDFIGNYNNVDLIPFWLSGKMAETKSAKEQIIKDLIEQKDIPSGCFIDFDFEVVDIFKKMIASKVKIQDQIKELYLECKKDLGHSPSRMAFFESLDELTYISIKGLGKNSPFKNYIAFVEAMEDGFIPNDFIDSDAYNYVRMIESTSMNKLYKIPILQAFYNAGTMKIEISMEDVCQSFYNFYLNKRHWPDIENDKSKKDFRQWTPEDYWTVARDNPINFLTKTHGEIFDYDATSKVMSIKLDLSEWLKDEFFIDQVKDAVDYRRAEFVDGRLV
jgi:hypothetical protein